MYLWICYQCPDKVTAATESLNPSALVYCKKCGNIELWGPFSEADFAQASPITRSARENWRRILQKVRVVTRGSFPNALRLHQSYYLESLDPRHRYGLDLEDLFGIWSISDRQLLFLDWIQEKGRRVRGIDYISVERAHITRKVTIAPDARVQLPAPFPPDEREKLTRDGGKVIFTQDRWSNIFAGIKWMRRLQHASFVDGWACKMAGDMELRRDLTIRMFSNYTGHYRSDAAATLQFAKYLRDECHVDLRGITLQFFRPDNQKQAEYEGPLTTWITGQEAAASQGVTAPSHRAPPRA